MFVLIQRESLDSLTILPEVVLPALPMLYLFFKDGHVSKVTLGVKNIKNPQKIICVRYSKVIIPKLT